MKYNAQILGRKNAFTCSQFSIKISSVAKMMNLVHLSESLNATLTTDCFQELLSVKQNYLNLRKLEFAIFLVCMKSEKHLKKNI